MNDLEGLLATDFGLKPQGKSASMAASKGSSNLSASSLNFDLGSLSDSRSNRTSNSFRGDDLDSHFLSGGSNQKNQDFGGLDDLLGGSTRYAGKSNIPGVVYDDVKFDSNSGAESSNSPVYDKPVYDDDIFDSMPGLQRSIKHNYDDVFSSMSSPQKGNAAAFYDLLPGFGKAEPMSTCSSGKILDKDDQNIPAFDDLMKGFGSSSSHGKRSTSEVTWSSEHTREKDTSKLVDEPFNLSGQYTDPLEEISKIGSAGSTKFDSIPASNGKVLDDLDPFAGLGKSIPTFSSNESNVVKRSSNPLQEDVNISDTGTNTNKEATEKEATKSPQHHLHKDVSDASDRQFNETLFDMPTVSTNSSKFVHQSVSPPSYDSTRSKDTDMPADMTPKYEKYAENSELSADIWLSVSDIPLFTQPTHAPPPSRPPPPVPVKITKTRTGSSTATTAIKKVNDYYPSPNFLQYSHVTRSAPEAVASVVSPIDELEDFAMGRSQNNVHGNTNGFYSKELEMNSAAAAMKEAMDRAEAKFTHAKEVRERESIKVTRSKEPVYPDQDERTMQDERTQKQERERAREREEKEREQRRLESERDRAREREEREREQRRFEREKERVRELEREREKARQAVERATREARERAAHEARARAERAAVDKANAEARQRAERAAVQRVQAEARERAAADAREKLERAAAEARERENTKAKERETQEKAFAARAEAEARARAERSSVERATAEARERAAAEARERAAASARSKPQKNDNDLESFFNASGQASSAPRHRANSSDPLFDNLSKNRPEPEVARTSSGSSSSTRKVSSSSNVIDDLSSIFSAAPLSGGFQEVEGESEERRRARMERHQRTEERAAKALAEKNQRDLQLLKDQAERHRIAETLDVEIKRWAAGKEGNLRALLSTLQYVIWPECGWQPVSLTDMITAANVKKVYRKATLCIHPDKVQQKGANLQQKYIAEKVFDILKEAWNKFNSEELF